MRLCSLMELAIIALLFPALIGCQALEGPERPGTVKDGLFGLRRQGQRSFDPNEALDPMGARRVDQIVLDDLSPSNIKNTIETRLLDRHDPELAKSLFAEAQQVYNDAIATQKADPEGTAHKEKFVEAAKKFRIAASRWPESTVEEDSIFFEGQAYFFADHYVDANRAYEKLLSLYSGTRYLDKAEQHRFAVALYWLELDENEGGITLSDPSRPKMNLVSEARRILHRIRIDDPTGKFADDATNALADAYFKDGRYSEAADTYEDLRRNYPGSSFQFHAHLFELKSRLMSYQGRSYDDQPLRKADDLMRIIVQQFPQEAHKQKDFLAKEATEIQNLLAERDIAMAEYFEGRGENRAAKIYYEQVAADYSHTNLAEEMQEQIAEVEAKPPTPPERGKWLVDLFPKPASQKPVLTAGNEKIFK